VPVPANGPLGDDNKATLHAGSTRNRSVGLPDVSAVLAYSGRTNSNSGAKYYNGDLNNDGIPDGRQMDRTPSIPPTGNIKGPPDGSLGLPDVSVTLSESGDNCSLFP
jgi:hypothetical protein